MAVFVGHSRRQFSCGQRLENLLSDKETGPEGANDGNYGK